MKKLVLISVSTSLHIQIFNVRFGVGFFSEVSIYDDVTEWSPIVKKMSIDVRLERN